MLPGRNNVTLVIKRFGGISFRVDKHGGINKPHLLYCLALKVSFIVTAVSSSIIKTLVDLKHPLDATY